MQTKPQVEVFPRTLCLYSRLWGCCGNTTSLQGQTELWSGDTVWWSCAAVVTRGEEGCCHLAATAIIQVQRKERVCSDRRRWLTEQWCTGAYLCTLLGLNLHSIFVGCSVAGWVCRWNFWSISQTLFLVNRGLDEKKTNKPCNKDRTWKHVQACVSVYCVTLTLWFWYSTDTC